MTLNERFVGGNPRVVLLLLCLFCVILICFVGICPNIMRNSEKNLRPLTGKLGTARACGGTAVPVQTHQNAKFSSKVRTTRACGDTTVCNNT